jgi:hypothetical protein
MGQPPVYVCKKCKRSECLRDFFDSAGVKVKAVGCQKLCAGPVVGVEVAGRMEWFEKVDRAKPMVAIVRIARGKAKRSLPKALAKRREPRWSGRDPR